MPMMRMKFKPSTLLLMRAPSLISTLLILQITFPNLIFP